MKGIVFNLLEAVVTAEYGADIWDSLLDAAKLEGAYTSLGSYPDDEIVALVGAASAALSLPASDILRWFGRKAMPLLAERYPMFFQNHRNARSFLLTLNHIIHPEVQKLYPGATTPVFDFGPSTDDTMVIGYRSDRKLCMLAEGFILGAADCFDETLQVEQSECMHHGAEKCIFTLTLSS